MTWSKLRDKGRLIFLPLVKLFSSLPPNLITLIGFLVVIVAAILIFFDKFRIGGVVLIIGSIFDAVDGQVARVQGKTSKFGAFLDSTAARHPG